MPEHDPGPPTTTLLRTAYNAISAAIYRAVAQAAGVDQDGLGRAGDGRRRGAHGRRRGAVAGGRAAGGRAACCGGGGGAAGGGHGGQADPGDDEFGVSHGEFLLRVGRAAVVPLSTTYG